MKKIFKILIIIIVLLFISNKDLTINETIKKFNLDNNFNNYIISHKTNNKVYISSKGIDKKNAVNSIFHSDKYSEIVLSLALTELLMIKNIDINSNIPKNIKIRNIYNTQISYKDLINHTSGLEYKVKDYFKDIDVNELSLKVAYKPKKSYIYSKTNYYVIAKILEDIANKKYQEVVEELVIKKINLSNSFYNNKNRTKIINSYYAYIDNRIIDKVNKNSPYNFVTNIIDILKINNYLLNLKNKKKNVFFNTDYNEVLNNIKFIYNKTVDNNDLFFNIELKNNLTLINYIYNDKTIVIVYNKNISLKKSLDLIELINKTKNIKLKKINEKIYFSKRDLFIESNKYKSKYNKYKNILYSRILNWKTFIENFSNSISINRYYFINEKTLVDRYDNYSIYKKTKTFENILIIRITLIVIICFYTFILFYFTAMKNLIFFLNNKFEKFFTIIIIFIHILFLISTIYYYNFSYMVFYILRLVGTINSLLSLFLIFIFIRLLKNHEIKMTNKILYFLLNALNIVLVYILFQWGFILI